MTSSSAARGSAGSFRRSPSLVVDDLLDDPDMRVVVCCGAGGVGKTTIAAALALRHLSL